jgi:hypothetical protein
MSGGFGLALIHPTQAGFDIPDRFIICNLSTMFATSTRTNKFVRATTSLIFWN